ncbi:transglutaminase TgpA family protein [Haloplanus salinarum]|uniref:transglutaminase TgpA family protein n=1 Tax=Haloplanus salinarum TaxID=1912324 RepID=UPI00214C8AFA|nr:transglutaminaseTgpA domain-containing protein [Haloplanus salinarum]
MSVEAADRSGLLPWSIGPDFRLAALCSLVVLTAAYGSVLYRVTDVVGGSRLMLATLVGAATLAVATGRVLRVRTALLLAALSLVAGFAVYFLSVPASQRALISPERLLSDTVALLTGLSVLRLTQANVWALSVAPTPVFLSWYLAVRRRYVSSVVVGGTVLAMLVLTGDAGTLTTLAGVVGAAAVVGFGTLDRYGGTGTQVDTLVILLAVMVVAAASLSVVPATRTAPVLPDRGSPAGVTSLVDTQDRVEVVGTIRLSPQVQFSVESRAESYWTTATYDRYTGTGWVRSGDTSPYGGRLDGPPGDGPEVRQTVTAETELGAMPAAWRPTAVTDIPASRVRVTPQGTLRPATTLDPGERYTVTSRLNRPSSDELRAAGTDYPDGIRERYTQLPASTPDRVRERAATVADEAGAETPYGTAVAIESYLEANKRYSLTVERPEGSVADAFLFEMDAGYCTYYATTMVTMLRAEGVPARFVTGYTPGERVAEDEWVVRGLDSHAWVQVYVPDEGWVRFDPTPAAPRESAEQARLNDARRSDEAGVDTAETRNTTPVSTAADPASVPNTTSTVAPAGGDMPDTQPDAVGDADPVAASDADRGPTLPSRETLALWGVVLVGIGAAARRTGAGARAVRAVWLRRRGPRRDPDTDAIRAFERLQYLLERQERPRRPGETPRTYVERVTTDDRARLVLRTYERARYGDGVDREAADAVTDAVGELVRERTLPTRPFAR